MEARVSSISAEVNGFRSIRVQNTLQVPFHPHSWLLPRVPEQQTGVAAQQGAPPPSEPVPQGCFLEVQRQGPQVKELDTQAALGSFWEGLTKSHGTTILDATLGRNA